MFSDFIDRENARYGDASFCSEADLRASGMFRSDGAFFGYERDRPTFVSGDSPLASFSGSGGSKTSAIAIPAIIHAAHEPAVINDPKGQIGSVVAPALARAGTWAFFFNPFGIAGNPQHRCSPYDFLRLDSPYLHAEAATFSAEAVPQTIGTNSSYFEQSAQQWYGAFLKTDLERNGGTSPPAIARIINLMDSGGRWADFIELMLASHFPDVRQVASDILYKSQEAPREYTAIKSELVLHTAYLNDPLVAAALEGNDFSMSDLLSPTRNVHVYLNAPAEHLGHLAPAIKSIFTAVMLLKARHPGGRRILLLVDEAPALGSFPSLMRSIVYGRGAGIRCWTFWQSISQITQHHGPTAVQTVLGSSQLRQFFSVRDYETAQLVSNMLGVQTLEYDDTLAQSAARRQAHNAAAKALLLGDDPFTVGADFAHFARAASNRTRQARPLLTPAEVLALPDDRQIAFVSGKNLKPFLGWKRPYWERPELAGLYLADPHHPPSDSVQVMGPRGPRRARIITGPVPAKYRDFAQYRSGLASWVEGFPL